MKLEKEKLPKLIEELKKLGAKEENPPPHALSRLRLDNSIITIYKSGSIVFGGKETEEAKKLVAFLVSRETDRTPRIGCDEAGKGEFTGPLVLACIYADESAINKLIELQVKDSKKLTKSRILKLADEIKKVCHGAVSVITPQKYNELYEKHKNANRLMEEAYLKLINKLFKKFKAEKIVVDRFSRTLEKKLKENFPDKEIEVIPRADEKDIVVAAASIVAKAERLKFMEKLSKEAGFTLPEGNLKNRELLEKIPPHLHHKFFKTHFNVGEKDER